MTYALIGTIALLVLLNGISFYALHKLHGDRIKEHEAERVFWQHQLDKALNRSQFPDIAAMQSATEPTWTAPVEQARAQYMDEALGV